VKRALGARAARRSRAKSRGKEADPPVGLRAARPSRAKSRRLAAALLAAALALAGPTASAGPWDLPPDGACAPGDGLRGWPLGEDAPPAPFATGDVLGQERLALLESFLPPAIWQHRERFFFEGMRLEIGACFRDYSPPPFFAAATEKFAGQARLTADGGLEGYTAGLPFPPAAIDPADPEAGQKWAWNAAQRYQAGGMGS